jgi:hypothetical protein
VSKADSQQGNIQLFNYSLTNAEIARLVWSARTRTDDAAIGLDLFYSVPVDPVILNYDGLLAIHLREELANVERERVVVVDDERSHSEPSIAACR